MFVLVTAIVGVSGSSPNIASPNDQSTAIETTIDVTGKQSDGSAVGGASDRQRDFNKTIAAQFNVMLEKEFEQETEEKKLGSTGAGRSFSDTVRAEGGTLETVARVHRPRGGEASGEELEAKDKPPQTAANSVGLLDKFDTKSSTSTPVGLESFVDTKDETLLKQLAGVKRDIDRALGGKEVNDDVERLVDSADNEFVISNPKSGTMELQQDLRLINDLVIMLSSAALGGILFTLLKQPLMTGYLVAGSLVGPGGFGMIVELVQVETFAQFGIIFLLFGLGLEFNFMRLRHVQAVAVWGGLCEMLLSMLVCGVMSDFAGASAKEGIFVGAFFSVSSTAIVGKCLLETGGVHSVHAQITMGTLVLQDCTIGLLFALIPVLGDSQGLSASFMSVFKVLLKMSVFITLCGSFSSILTRRLLKFAAIQGEESHQLITITYCLMVACVTEWFGLSMELGAFLAGVSVSMTPVAEKTLHSLEPFRNVFTALFLTSIGLIMNPHFLWMHLDVLLTSVFLLILFKTALITVVVRAFGYGLCTSLAVGISLSQVGELSFVLLSRAAGAELIERKLYLLLLGTTAISLVLTPTLFRFLPVFMRTATTLHLISKEEAIDAMATSAC